MTQDTITRLRNAFALVAIEMLDEQPSETVAASFAPPFSSMTEADWRSAVHLWRAHAGAVLADVPARPCPGCGSEKSRWLFDSYDAHRFHECDSCGCWFVPKRVDSAVFDRFFERCPEAEALARSMMQKRETAEQSESDINRIGGYLDDLLPLMPGSSNTPRAYLDLGCGVGHSLRAGRARGLVVQGVEVDRTALELARADGLPVATLGESIPAGPYALISLWETLEHVATPLETLKRYLPFLADDGLIAITVPNLNAPASRTMREACSWVHGGYNTPGHVNLFHAPSIETLLARAGLTMIEADGQFSSDPVELAAFLRGATRGVVESLDPSLERRMLPVAMEQSFKAIWPGMALIERASLASPILRVVACRQGREDVFAAAIAGRKARRRQEMIDEARSLMAYETDYRARSAKLEAMTVELQLEVDRRDADLLALHDERTGAVNLRDQIIKETRDERDTAVSLRDNIIREIRGVSTTEDSRMLRVWRRTLARLWR